VPEIIHADQRLTIREVAEEVRIAFVTCQKILTKNLRMRRVTAKFLPRLLTAEQKDDRVSICTDLRDRAQNDPNFMSSVITGDECWMKSNIKTMLIAFFDSYYSLIDYQIHIETGRNMWFL
jgi:histone-lysine N-methyltransferase SETMAR